MAARLLSAVSSRESALAAFSCSSILYYSIFSNSSPTLNERRHERNQQKTAANKNNATFYGQCLERQLYHPKQPYPAWDYNWDGRMTPSTSQEILSTVEGLQQSRQLGKVRHILLIRHGQYDETFKEDDKKKLTRLGRKQAELTGQRLALIARGGRGGIHEQFAGPSHIKAIHVSDMTRAKETGKLQML